MSYSPKTGLVYIPVNEAAQPYNAAAEDWEPSEVGFQTGMDIGPLAAPADANARRGIMAATKGYLMAFDPVAGKATLGD